MLNGVLIVLGWVWGVFDLSHRDHVEQCADNGACCLICLTVTWTMLNGNLVC